MIITENLGTVERRYSDQNMKIRQIETNTVWNDAVNTIPCQYTYEETNIPIDPLDIPDNLNEATDFLLKSELMELPTPEPEPDYLNEHEEEPDYFE